MSLSSFLLLSPVLEGKKWDLCGPVFLKILSMKGKNANWWAACQPRNLDISISVMNISSLQTSSLLAIALRLFELVINRDCHNMSLVEWPPANAPQIPICQSIWCFEKKGTWALVDEKFSRPKLQQTRLISRFTISPLRLHFRKESGFFWREAKREPTLWTRGCVCT